MTLGTLGKLFITTSFDAIYVFSAELFPTVVRCVKPRPNDRNMSTQHVATLLGATCCVRLATVLRCVATCWMLLA